MYAIIDIETTGLSANAEKITEIAIFIHDGNEIKEEFCTLINPEKKIPYRITQMTGITNQMVEGAPKFYEVGKKIVELTEGKTIVGHNVSFDYSFLRSEFKSFGYDYSRKVLDTVRLSRKLIPGRKSYSLGKLCNDLGIANHARHRAAGDALATTRLFEMLRGIDPELENVKLNGTQSNLTKSLIEGLPKQAGVYYFYNNSGQLIYVGKSINIHDRVLSHLNNNLHKKAIEMKNAIAHVGFELTGSELVALLLESAEIKKHQPLYNSQQKRTYFNYGLYSFFDDQGYLNLKIIRIISSLTPIYTYSSAQEGKEHLFRLVEEFRLCQKLCGLYDTSGACFHYQISQCDGACIGSETTEAYNRKVQTAIEEYNFENSNFFILENGREDGELAVIKVENGKYQGFGYMQNEAAKENTDALHDCIKVAQDNREVRQIINTFLKKNKEAKTILF